MDLTVELQKLVQDIIDLSEGFGSIENALQYAKHIKANLNYNIPDHMWPEIEVQIEELISKYCN